MSKNSVHLEDSLGSVFPQSQIFPIESEFFQGKAIVLIHGIHEHLENGISPVPSNYFHGKKRKFEAVVQGRFKNTISFADVYVGQIFTGHLNCAPPDWLLALLLPIMQAISPGLKMDLGHPENPYLLSPLMSTMQSICINQPGHEPGILDLIGTTRDDLNILDKELNIFSGMDIQKRKTYFSNIENLNQFQFDPSLVYSFGFFQHIINMTNRLIEPMPFVTYSLDHVLDQRPIQFMAAVLPSQQFFEPTASCTSSLDDKRNIGASPNPSPNISPDPKPATNRLSETKLKREPVHKMLEWKYIFDVKVCKAEN